MINSRDKKNFKKERDTSMSRDKRMIELFKNLNQKLIRRKSTSADTSLVSQSLKIKSLSLSWLLLRKWLSTISQRRKRMNKS
jgi:hypothetical protein